VAKIHYASLETSILMIGSFNPGNRVFASYPTCLYSLIAPSKLPRAKPPYIVVAIALNWGFDL